jgi:MFS family permease
MEQPTANEEGLSLREALATHTFWVMALGLAGTSALVNAMTAHIIPFFNHVGLAEVAGFMAAAVPLSSIAGRVGFGWLGDHFDKRRVLVITFIFQTAGIILLAYAWSFWLYIPALILFGPGYGGSIALRGAIQADYFGRRAFGSIQGATMAVVVAISLPAPIFVGAMVDSTGSYQLAFLILGLITLIGIPLILAVRRTSWMEQQGP